MESRGHGVTGEKNGGGGLPVFESFAPLHSEGETTHPEAIASETTASRGGGEERDNKGDVRAAAVSLNLPHPCLLAHFPSSRGTFPGEKPSSSSDS